MLEHCTEVWLQSSLQLHLISQGRGIKYFHFLQPNQYVPGSKPMGREEIKVAIDEGHPAKPYVIAGYPLLQAAGRRLQEQQVRFQDLTQVFSETTAPTYTDSCCHLNSEGNRLLAAAIAKAIGAPR